MKWTKREERTLSSLAYQVRNYILSYYQATRLAERRTKNRSYESCRSKLKRMVHDIILSENAKRLADRQFNH